MLQFFETFNLQIAYNSNLISKFALLTKNEMSNKEPGYVYILTNPASGKIGKLENTVYRLYAN
jgi:hypothetical protein